MIKYNIEKHTIGWLGKKNREDSLDFSISIQRKEVWDDEHKANLIASILIGIPVESLLFEEDEEGGYKVLDGKQRSTSILQFINNEYPINSKCKIPEIEGISLVGKYFKDLPENFQDDLKEYELSIAVIRPLSEEEREVLFFMRNQAVPLTKTELTRVVAGRHVMDRVQKFTQHNFISTKVNLTQSALKRYTDQQIILQIFMLESKLNTQNVDLKYSSILENALDLSFSGADLMKYAQNIRDTAIPQENQEEILSIFDYLDEAIPELNKNLRKTHIPMLYVIAKKAMHQGVSTDRFFAWMTTFFKYIRKVGNKYSDACSAGSSKKANIIKRLVFLEEYFDEHIGDVEIESDLKNKDIA